MNNNSILCVTPFFSHCRRLLAAAFLLGSITQPLHAWALDSDKDGIPDAVDSAPANIALPGFSRLYTFNGDNSSDVFRQSVSAAGDVNNDGYADVIIGAPLGDNAGENSGSARVWSGANGALLYTFNGDSAGDFFGISVSGAGDVNGDGYADVIVGAYLDDNNGMNSGSARVLSGANGSILYNFNGDSAYDFFGVSVSGAGDINNDGYADVIVGAQNDDNNGSDSGSARVISGANGSILYTFNGDSAGDNFGYSVSDAGDVNKDGYADVLVGAYSDDNNGKFSGAARVLSGANGEILYTFSGDSEADFFGYSVSGAGDVNNDGYADVLVGASGDDNNGTDSGSARVLSGANGSILYAFNGDSAGDNLGWSVSGAGDVNNDGYADVIVGAYTDDNNGGNSGSARVLSGANGSILYTFNGDIAHDILGYSVSGAGDVNNDGFADVIVMARTDVNSGGNRGNAFVYSGALFFAYTPDADGDRVVDERDAFPNDASEWADTDGDGIGNNADPSDDGDAVADVSDNCLNMANDNQLDFDNDGLGDVCDDDLDGDTIANASDNCSWIVNADQADADGDSLGNACDASIYGDVDFDGIGDLDDNCPSIANANQQDADNDRNGDVCDASQGGAEMALVPAQKIYASGGEVIVKVLPSEAGYTSELYLSSPAPARFIATNRDAGTVVNLGVYPAGEELIFSIYVRNTSKTFYSGPASRNPDSQLHAAADLPAYGPATVGFEDLDGGGDQDFNDNMFRFLGLTSFADNDGDGTGDYYDLDDDNDGVPDVDDALPFDAGETLDADHDGIGNTTDTDDDNDGVIDASDRFPFDAAESVDTDNDDIGNNADADDDNDGLSDTAEDTATTNPLIVDTDGDGLLDGVEVLTHFTNPKSTDSDSDGMPDPWEISNGLKPLSGNDDLLDNDGDGWTNEQEQQRGTNPNSSASKPFGGSGRTITLNNTDSGWYQDNGYHDPNIQDYFTGMSTGSALRGFWSFQLPSDLGPIVLATLKVYRHTYSSVDTTETLGLWDVTTASSLMLGGSGGAAGFADLGSGNKYAELIVSASTPKRIIIDLNQSARDDLLMKKGQVFMMGAAISTLSGTSTQSVFSMSAFTPGNQLVLLEVVDEDGDGMPDSWENAHGLNKNSAADALLDKDGDGLINLQEYLNRTSLSVADTDADGWNDYREVMVERSNPLVVDFVDTDSDGIGNTADGDDDGDGTLDSIDGDPLDPANTTEVILPFGGDYRGSSVIECSSAQ